MDCSSVSAAERVCDCEEGVQCPNERNPIFFIQAIYGFRGELPLRLSKYQDGGERLPRAELLRAESAKGTHREKCSCKGLVELVEAAQVSEPVSFQFAVQVRLVGGREWHRLWTGQEIAEPAPNPAATIPRPNCFLLRFMDTPRIENGLRFRCRTTVGTIHAPYSRVSRLSC